MFARYSRTTKSLRRLFLDEFAEDVDGGAPSVTSMGRARAEQLYERVFVEYGDDSVAQLGGVHLACEQSSQLLAKALEWGRLAAYLEQSTRYMRYDDRPGGRWRATVPPELDGTPARRSVRGVPRRGLRDVRADVRARWRPGSRERFPKEAGDTDFVYRQTILAKTCDTLRVLLPAGTRSNLGIYATGQSYEQLLMRLAVHPLAEMREYGELMKVELRKVIPEFLKRVDVEERGVAWSRYWRDEPRARRGAHGRDARRRRRARAARRGHARRLGPRGRAEDRRRGAVRRVSDLPDDQLLALVARDDARPSASEILRGERRRPRRTADTSPAARGSARSTGSTCCATTARSATCSGTVRSRSSGSA